MLKFGVISVAAALLSTASLAQGVYPVHRHHRQHHAYWTASPQMAFAAPSYEPPSRYYQSQSSCAPDRGEPVWGAGNSFEGYSCVPESANGN